jgi:hypothetical protein
MFCRQCGNKIENDNQKYCAVCGAAVAIAESGSQLQPALSSVSESSMDISQYYGNELLAVLEKANLEYGEMMKVIEPGKHLDFESRKLDDKRKYYSSGKGLGFIIVLGIVFGFFSSLWSCVDYSLDIIYFFIFFNLSFLLSLILFSVVKKLRKIVMMSRIEAKQKDLDKRYELLNKNIQSVWNECPTLHLFPGDSNYLSGSALEYMYKTVRDKLADSWKECAKLWQEESHRRKMLNGQRQILENSREAKEIALDAQKRAKWAEFDANLAVFMSYNNSPR